MIININCFFISTENNVDSINFTVILKNIVENLVETNIQNFAQEIAQDSIINNNDYFNEKLLTKEREEKLIEEELKIYEIEEKYYKKCV